MPVLNVAVRPMSNATSIASVLAVHAVVFAVPVTVRTVGAPVCPASCLTVVAPPNPTLNADVVLFCTVSSSPAVRVVVVFSR